MRKLILRLLCVIGLAVACRGVGLGDGPKADEKKQPQKASAEELKKLYQQMIKDLGSPGFARRDNAYKQLLKSPGAVGELRRALATPGLSPETKRRVENLLEALDVEKLLEKLEGEQEQSDAAYGTLTKFGLNHGEELLMIYKAVDEKSKAKLAVVFGKVRVAAIEAKRDDLAGIMEDALLQCLRDPDHYIVSRASYGLMGHGHPSKKALPIFVKILESNHSTGLARSAAWCGLRDLGPAASEAIPTLLDCLNTKVEVKLDLEGKPAEEVIKSIDNAKDYVPGERGSICSVLAIVGPKDERVFAALKKAVLDRKESRHVRTAAMWHVANMGERGQVILPELMKILKETRGARIGTERHEEAMLRCSAIAALGKLQLSKENIPALVQVVGDPDEESKMRRDALAALIHSRGFAQGAWRPLLKLIQGDPQSSWPIERIVIALREIEPPKGADRAVLARELRSSFDKILQRDPNDYLADEMDKTVKAIQKNKRP